MASLKTWIFSWLMSKGKIWAIFSWESWEKSKNKRKMLSTLNKKYSIFLGWNSILEEKLINPRFFLGWSKKDVKKYKIKIWIEI